MRLLTLKLLPDKNDWLARPFAPKVVSRPTSIMGAALLTETDTEPVAGVDVAPFSILAVIVYGGVTATPVAGVPPTVAVAPASSCCPVRVTDVPVAGPERGSTFRRMDWEISEVLPSGSVAIAVTGWPVVRGVGSW